MSNVALIGSFVWVYFYLLCLFNFCSLNLFIYIVIDAKHFSSYRLHAFCTVRIFTMNFVFKQLPV